MLVAKKALKKKQHDKEILSWKIELVKELMKGGYEQEKIRKTMNFIKFFMNFGNKEVVNEYEKELSNIIETRTNMGIEQSIIEHFKREGKLEGRKEGKLEGKLEGRKEGEHLKAIKTAEKCLQKGMSIEDTAELTELSIEIVQELLKKRSIE
jgi:predicted transposase YdaD